ncbi:MAG: hypothetical protein VB878_24785 [Pirellulaceae bacterium]
MFSTRTVILVLLMTLVVCTVSFSVTMAFEWISQLLGDAETALVLRWAAGTMFVLGSIDGFLLLICVTIRSVNQSDPTNQDSS